jgi:hypothetical protein
MDHRKLGELVTLKAIKIGTCLPICREVEVLNLYHLSFGIACGEKLPGAVYQERKMLPKAASPSHLIHSDMLLEAC